MKPESADWAKMTETLQALRLELACLTERVTALETRGNTELGTRSEERRTLPEVCTPTSNIPVDAGLSEELILIISAAVAAYLGKKPRIQQIRLVGTPAWALQGRVAIQASHALATRQMRREH